MLVIKFKALEQNLICRVKKFKAELSQIFQHLTNGKLQKIVTILLNWKLRYANTLQHCKTAFEGFIFDYTIPWIILLFDANLDKIDDNYKYKNELIDLQSSTSLWTLFSWINDDNFKFWCK